jgi:hypothetical protein
MGCRDYSVGCATNAVNKVDAAQLSGRPLIPIVMVAVVVVTTTNERQPIFLSHTKWLAADECLALKCQACMCVFVCVSACVWFPAHATEID